MLESFRHLTLMTAYGTYTLYYTMCTEIFHILTGVSKLLNNCMDICVYVSVGV